MFSKNIFIYNMQITRNTIDTANKCKWQVMRTGNTTHVFFTNSILEIAWRWITRK